MIELLIVIEDEQGVSGVGPGGSTKMLQAVKCNGVLVGYIDVHEYREGVYVDAIAQDGKTNLYREPKQDVAAFMLAQRYYRNDRRRG
jgi:hypothetical protein